MEKDENVLEMDGGNGSKTMLMCLMPENSKTVTRVNFILCMFFNNKKGLKMKLKIIWKAVHDVFLSEKST